MSSFSARAGDWPATGKEFLDKNKVTYRVNDRAQLVINIKKMTYSAYAPGGGATFCRGGEISTIIEISDSVIEIDAVPNKETKCLGKLLTINLKEKSATLIDYDFTGNRADVKGSYKVDSPNFD